MWYRTAKKILAQELNVPGPIYGLPGLGKPAPVWTPPARRRVPVQPVPQQVMPPQAMDPNFPQQTMPQMPPEAIPGDPMGQTPYQQPQQPSVPDDGIPDKPNPIPLSPEDQQVLGMRPPLHDRCHCTVEKLPGGRMIWNVNETACEQCQKIGQHFNELQSAQFDA